MSTEATAPASTTTDVANDAATAPSPSKGKGKGKSVEEPMEEEEDEDEEDEDEEEEEEEEEDDDDDEEEEVLDPSVIVSGRRRTARVDYTSAEALQKAGLKPEDEHADDEEDPDVSMRDD